MLATVSAAVAAAELVQRVPSARNAGNVTYIHGNLPDVPYAGSPGVLSLNSHKSRIGHPGHLGLRATQT